MAALTFHSINMGLKLSIMVLGVSYGDNLWSAALLKVTKDQQKLKTAGTLCEIGDCTSDFRNANLNRSIT